MERLAMGNSFCGRGSYQKQIDRSNVVLTRLVLVGTLYNIMY